jgi:predicted RNase H-like HicB family nuclease
MDWEMMMENKYEILIYWSKIDNRYIAEVPELPGCMADGFTYEEALESAKIVIQEWIETAMEDGEPIPEPKGKKLMFA